MAFGHSDHSNHSDLSIYLYVHRHNEYHQYTCDNRFVLTPYPNAFAIIPLSCIMAKFLFGCYCLCNLLRAQIIFTCTSVYLLNNARGNDNDFPFGVGSYALPLKHTYMHMKIYTDWLLPQKARTPIPVASRHTIQCQGWTRPETTALIRKTYIASLNIDTLNGMMYWCNLQGKGGL